MENFKIRRTWNLDNGAVIVLIVENIANVETMALYKITPDREKIALWIANENRWSPFRPLKTALI